MKTIMVFNQKGGVGKSTTVSNLMAELTKKGNRVLGIDLDGQGHLSKFLNIDTDGKDTILELLRGQAAFKEVVRSTKYGDVIPSDNALQKNMLVFAQDTLFLFKMKNILNDQKKNYDYVLLDCPPALNQVTIAGLVASNYLIIPTEAEKFSIDGISEIIESIKDVKQELNKELRVLGLLLTKYNSRRNMTKQSEILLAEVAKKYFNSKLFDVRISLMSDIPYSQAENKCVSDYKVGCKSALEYENLTAEILKEMH